MIIYHQDQALKRWAGEILGVSDFGPSRTIGVWRQGRIVAVVVYHQFRYPSIEASIASIDPRWASRSVIREILRYPFVTLGCKRITAITEATNQRARAFLCRLGFHEEGIHPDTFETGDAVSYGLLRKDAARWLAEEDTCVPIPSAA